MTKGKKIGFGVLALLAIAIVVAIAWPKDTRPEMETALAQEGTVSKTVELTGNVTYPETRRASFLLSGYLNTLNVKVGQKVVKGQVLATLQDASGAPYLSKSQTALLRLTSPIDGIVTGIAAQPGEAVSAGMLVVVVQGPEGEFEVTMQVSENDIAKLVVGDDVTIRVEAIDDAAEFFGTIREIAPTAVTAQGVVTYTVIVTLDSANSEGKGAMSQLRAGMTADVSVVATEVRDVVYVPRRAVLTRNDVEYVRVVVDNDVGYEERAVVTGLRGDDNRVEIVSGLAEGEEIVVKIVE